MEIDNSAAQDWRFCPWYYYERYIKEGTGIEVISDKETYGPLELGLRVHELLEEHYTKQSKYPIHPNEKLEEEAQWMMQGYRARYPQEDFEILDVEKTFKVALPDYCPKCYQIKTHYVNDDKGNPKAFVYCGNCNVIYQRNRHVMTGKIDLFYRQDNELFIMDHKTEKRSSKSNLPQKWAARDQGTQYLWAAEKIYNPPINRFIVNILRRPSPAGREGPEFPDRQRIERTEIQIETALRDLVYVADRIEDMKRIFGDKPWPAHRENCYTWGQCDFYQPHLYGWSDHIRKYKFQNRKPYLELGGVPIIQ